MKWEKAAGSTQQSSCGRYCIVQANSQTWIAYRMHSTTAEQLGERKTDAEARECCEEASKVAA